MPNKDREKMAELFRTDREKMVEKLRNIVEKSERSSILDKFTRALRRIFNIGTFYNFLEPFGLREAVTDMAELIFYFPTLKGYISRH